MKDLLIKSAETIEALSAEIVELNAKIASVEAERLTLAQAISAKTAADTAASAAEETAKADLAGKAKLACDALRAAGTIASDENRDKLVAKIAASHSECLAVIHKLASQKSTTVKQAEVVIRDNPIQTADQAWTAGLARLSTGGQP